MKARMSGWFARTLSMEGKEVLIKAVALAMPVYAMSLFQLPKMTIKALNSAMSDFWWNSMEEKRKIHWISWDRMCLPKENGGLGFRDLECFNQALLAKQAWRLLQCPQSLCARFVKSRYYNNEQFLEAELGKNPSFAWRSIIHGRKLLAQGMDKLVGNGDSIKVWCDPWLEDGRKRIPLMKNIFINIDMKVRELIDQDNGQWDLQRLKDLFYDRDIGLITKKKPVVSQDDFWVWNHTRSGDYDVRSGYWYAYKIKHKELITTASTQPSINGLLMQIWGLKAPLKIQIFLWKAVSGAIPVVDLLAKRGVHIDSRCQLCGLEGESPNHILFACTLDRQMWAETRVPWPQEGFHQESIYQNMSYVMGVMRRIQVPAILRKSIPWLMWRLWKNRNNILFEGKYHRADESKKKIEEDATNWFMAQQVRTQEEGRNQNVLSKYADKWKAPGREWYKCNIGVSWKEGKTYGGGAWVLRDHNGTVLMHSRMAFNSTCTKLELSLEIMIWAVESMRSHRVERVQFAVQNNEITGAILRPGAWPNFKGHAECMLRALRGMQEWRIMKEEHKTNMGAFRIAQSVTGEARFQSYVATGYPMWLQELFVEEAKDWSPSLGST